MNERSFLYFIPSKGEFLKIQPGTGDNLSAEDIAAGFTDYIIWNRFKVECLDIDGELPMECIDSGMMMLKGALENPQGGSAGQVTHELLESTLEMAYGCRGLEAVLLLSF